MQICRVRADEADVRRFVEECWLPYHADLDEIIPTHSLVDDLDQEAVVDHYCETLSSPSSRLWVARRDVEKSTAKLSRTDGAILGFVHTNLDAAPQTLDWPDRLGIRDLWVRGSHRGSGVADDLLARVVQQAREAGCAELRLRLSVDNHRAVSYVENLGFERGGFRMHATLADVSAGIGDRAAVDSPIQFRRLRIEEDVMSQFVEDCWRPFWEDLGDAVGMDHLDPELDRAELVADLLESYDVPDRRCWIALDKRSRCTDGEDVGPVDLADTDAVFAGWLNAGLEPTDRFLDPPERLFIGNLYARPAYRGSGLADQLVARAVQYANEEGCPAFSLGVDADNDRARAYYEKLGFEPLLRSFSVSLDGIEV